MARSAARPRRRRARHPTGTREALLVAATRLFAERGFDGVSVAGIAEAAGVNKALVSYHFGGKRKLYLAIIVSVLSEIAARAESLAASSEPAPDLLRAFVAAVGELASHRPHFPAMMLREVLAGGPRLEREIASRLVAVLGSVRRIVERGIREGAFRPVDPVFTHLSLVGSLLFFFATASFRRRVAEATSAPVDGLAVGDYVRHVEDLFTRGLAEDRPTAGPRRA